MCFRQREIQTSIPAKNEEMIGTLSLHANGSLTVKSVQGELSILDQDHIVLASLPSRETITIPSAVVSGKQRVMVAQVGDIEQGDRKAGDRKSDEGRGRASLPSLLGNAAAFLLNAGMVGLIVARPSMMMIPMTIDRSADNEFGFLRGAGSDFDREQR